MTHSPTLSMTAAPPLTGGTLETRSPPGCCINGSSCSARRDPHRDIGLDINSPGGSVSAGLAIDDTMRLVPNDVSTLAMGLAASMGQFLLSGGTPGERDALPHSRVLMHQGSAGIGGSAVDIEIQAENLERTKNVMMRLIAEHTGRPVERVERDSLRDRWFTAEQAREYGFVDHLLTDVADLTPAQPDRRVGLGRSQSYAGGGVR